MVKKDFQYKQQKSQKKNKIVPSIRYDKKQDKWTIKTKSIVKPQEELIMINKKQLDSIAKMVSYLYHDEQKSYLESSSDTRKYHIYQDLKEIDMWLTSVYKKLKESNEKKR